MAARSGTIAKELIKNAEKLGLHEKTVEDVRVGLTYVAVKLSGNDSCCGIGHVLRSELPTHCFRAEALYPMIGRNASELAELILEPDPLLPSIGIATINAVFSEHAEKLRGVLKGDVVDSLKLEDDDVVGMVGNFVPIVRRLEGRVKEIRILERKVMDTCKPKSQDIKCGCDEFVKYYPDWAWEDVLPECDVAIITASTIVNRTLDSLISACAGKAREVALVGPTTTLAPEVFRHHGVTFLGGVRISSSRKVMEIISQGGGMNVFGNGAEKISLRIGKTL